MQSLHKLQKKDPYMDMDMDMDMDVNTSTNAHSNATIRMSTDYKSWQNKHVFLLTSAPNVTLDN